MKSILALAVVTIAALAYCASTQAVEPKKDSTQGISAVNTVQSIVAEETGRRSRRGSCSSSGCSTSSGCNASGSVDEIARTSLQQRETIGDTPRLAAKSKASIDGAIASDRAIATRQTTVLDSRLPIFPPLKNTPPKEPAVTAVRQSAPEEEYIGPVRAAPLKASLIKVPK